MKRCGLFFIAITLWQSVTFADEVIPLDLEPIVVTKSKAHLLNYYSRESATLENLSLPLDLQSRSLKAGIQTDFSLRGSNFQGVLLLINGNRINDPQTAHHNADIPVTSQDIQRIEVIPGVSSALFGPDAVGGAINIILKKPQMKERILELSAGQHQTISGLLSISDKPDKLGWRFSVENKESDGFSEDTDFKKFTSHFSSSLDLPDGEFVLNLGYQEKEFGAYDFYTPASGYPSKEWTKTYLLNTSLNLDKEGFIIKPNFLWRRHHDKFMLDKTQVRTRYFNHHRTDVYTPGIYLEKEIALLGKLGLGLEYGEEEINSTNLGKHNREHKSIFIDESKDLNDKLSWGFSWRGDDFAGFGENYTGSANFKYKISAQSSLRFGVSRSMRIPSFTELYYNDPTTLGDAGLSAEKSLNYEAGYDWQKEKLSLGATFFFRQEKDFIDWIKRATTQAKWQVENITAAKVFGIENYLKLELNKNLSLDAYYTYIDKRIHEGGYLYKYGPNYIRHLVNAHFSVNLPFGTQVIGLTYKKKPRRDGWCLLGTRLSYQLNRNSQIFLNITNLLNVEYQEIEGIPQPGRWAEAGLRFQW